MTKSESLKSSQIRQVEQPNQFLSLVVLALVSITCTICSLGMLYFVLTGDVPLRPGESVAKGMVPARLYLTPPRTEMAPPTPDYRLLIPTLTQLAPASPDLGDPIPTPLPSATPGPIETPDNPHVIWSADMETGDLSQWYLPASAGGPGPGGGPIDKGSGRQTVTDKFAHNGKYSAELTIDSVPGQSQAVRLFRWGDNPQAAYYTAWFLFPKNYHPAQWWNILQFLDPSGNPNGTTWMVNVANRPNGDMSFELYDSQQGKNYTQSTSTIPVGRWTKLEVFYRRSNSGGGRITLWHDGLLLFDLDHVQTALGNEVQVSVDNYGLEVAPGPVTIYVDDVTISTQRIVQ